MIPDFWEERPEATGDFSVDKKSADETEFLTSKS